MTIKAVFYQSPIILQPSHGVEGVVFWARQTNGFRFLGPVQQGKMFTQIFLLKLFGLSGSNTLLQFGPYRGNRERQVSRRSSQTALHRLVIGLCGMLSPILAYTADEAWGQIPGQPAESVHLAEWTLVDYPENADWKQLFDLREIALPELEKARKAKEIGKSLEAAVSITAKPELTRFPAAELASMRELLNVSALDIQSSEDAGEPVVSVRKASGDKCERCWHWEPTVGKNSDHPTLCDRCVDAVKLYEEQA